MLKQRIATGLVLIGLFLAALFYLPKAGFAWLAAALVLLASWEWSNLAGLRSLLARLAFVVGSGLLMWLANDYVLHAQRDSQLALLASAGGWWLIALLWVKGFPKTTVLWANTWVKVLMGWFVLAPTWLAMVILLYSNGFASLPSENAGRWTLLTVVTIVVLMDTGGYFAGKHFGRRKLAPQVSPKKTWAGVVGGLLVNGLLLLFLGWQLSADANLWLLLALLIACTSVASVLGDLLESMVKRQRNIKDSGSILPGHGGILDRVDGMTAAFPIFTLIYLLAS
ncbi:phosphatidate cytidylyltransferase [Porticoccus sp. W117]|uniref:phosphatidate cytidylyltransferase n=1 Tax=Porticoccus sp. W117 TaxID=3054777 RepID=UPI00259ABA1A|nr:phosphatidate cytidylyltransferase [Porticoccus sp. W117]MDM3870267.1 phosphatidate cytidylyltransferase [Porticoccus sp. W117]